MNETNETQIQTSTRKTKAQRKAEAPVMSPKQLRRHEQINRTKEPGPLKLIESSQRNLRLALINAPIQVIALIDLIDTQKNQELVRLRRALLSERKHRERLAAGLIPRLRSKAQECRDLRDQIKGLNDKVKVERAARKALARTASKMLTKKVEVIN